ncbi:MAG TPA: type II secretion system secretin GspD [Gammaproteobacteria bacterium]|jgi:general secretion pathway protein D|nr:type II secretion system secretin GspD [Gammaproteobacteria bacterium]
MLDTLITKRRLFQSLFFLVTFAGSSVLYAEATVDPELNDPAIAAAIDAAVKEQKASDTNAALQQPQTPVNAGDAATEPNAITQLQENVPVPQPATRLWNLQDADILSVINEVSQETGKNFVVDPRVTGKISLVSSKPLRKGEVYNVFLSVLELLGYSAIPSGNVIKIVPNMESGEMATRVATKQSPGQGDEVVVRVIPLKNITATQLIPVLRPMMPQWSNISAYTPGNVLILLGRADNLKRIARIIQDVDQASDNSIQMIQLHHASAVQVGQVLNNLQAASRAAGETATVSIAVDDRSNSLLLSGPKALRVRMGMLIAQLDEPASAGAGNTEVVYLRYLQAKDFAPLLGKIAQNIQGKGGSDTSASAAPSTGSKTTASKEPENTTSIQAEPNSNAIIITAPPTLMKALKTVVSKLDIRPAQVLVEAIIAEIDEANLTALGIQWGSIQGSGPAIPTSGLPTSFPALGAGVVGVIPGSDITAVLSVLQNQTGVNILSTPSIVVLDNQKATIEVGQNVPMQTGSYATNTGGSNPQSGTPTPFTTIDIKPVTLKLDVTPQLNLGTSVRLQLALKNDTLQNPQNPGLTPIVNTSQIKNSVIINSSDILVLGGLISNSNNESINKVPILGNLPIIGALFQQKTSSQSKKNLMVFIKPVIMHNANEAMMLTQEKYSNIRSTQANFRDELAEIGDKEVPTLLPPWRNKKDLPTPFETSSQ